jgi:hypothetical protein
MHNQKQGVGFLALDVLTEPPEIGSGAEKLSRTITAWADLHIGQMVI